MHLPDLAARARALTRREWLDLGRAHVALLGAWRDVRLRRRGLSRLPLGRKAAPGRRESTCSPLDYLQRDRARQVARAVRRAVDHGPFRFSCLVAALALRRFLEREGLEGAVVRVGVRSDGRGFAAHAWVEFQGIPLLQPRHAPDAFTPLKGVDVFPNR